MGTKWVRGRTGKVGRYGNLALAKPCSPCCPIARFCIRTLTIVPGGYDCTIPGIQPPFSPCAGQRMTSCDLGDLTAAEFNAYFSALEAWAGSFSGSLIPCAGGYYVFFQGGSLAEGSTGVWIQNCSPKTYCITYQHDFGVESFVYLQFSLGTLTGAELVAATAALNAQGFNSLDAFPDWNPGLGTGWWYCLDSYIPFGNILRATISENIFCTPVGSESDLTNCGSY